MAHRNIHNYGNSNRNIKRTINSAYYLSKATTRKGMLGNINLRFTKHKASYTVPNGGKMKTKFNAKDVSNWCKWIAVDEDGFCYEYSIKPDNKRSIGEQWLNNGGQEKFLYKGKPPKNWRNELYTWGY